MFHNNFLDLLPSLKKEEDKVPMRKITLLFSIYLTLSHSRIHFLSAGTQAVGKVVRISSCGCVKPFLFSLLFQKDRQYWARVGHNEAHIISSIKEGRQLAKILSKALTLKRGVFDFV